MLPAAAPASATPRRDLTCSATPPPGSQRSSRATATDRPSLREAVAAIDGDAPVAVTGRLRAGLVGRPGPGARPCPAADPGGAVPRRGAGPGRGRAGADLGGRRRAGPDAADLRCGRARRDRSPSSPAPTRSASASSTSATATAGPPSRPRRGSSPALGGRGLDPEALAVQSQLGWQLGRRTMFAGVSQLAAGHCVTLGPDGATLRCFLPLDDGGEPTVEQAVGQARDLLRGHLRRLPRRPPGRGAAADGRARTPGCCCPRSSRAAGGGCG